MISLLIENRWNDAYRDMRAIMYHFIETHLCIDVALLKMPNKGHSLFKSYTTFSSIIAASY